MLRAIKTMLNKTMHDIRQEREVIIFALFIIAVFLYLNYSVHDDSRGAYAICTVEKTYIKDRGGTTVSGMLDTSPVGVFETKECGEVIMYNAPDGKRVPEYVASIQVGKKYKIHKLNDDANVEKNFTSTRLEEVQE